MNHHRTFMILLFVGYMIGMTTLMIWQGIGIAPDRYALVLLLGSLFIKRTRAFLFDWIPFLLILISYDFLRGFADNLIARTHFWELIKADQVVFGVLPTNRLQQLFYQPGHLNWYDYVATISYFLHFALPLSFGFLIWMENRTKFRQFVTGILILSYAAWITYVVYPAAPPWLASDQKYIPQVHKIINQTLSAFPDRFHLPTIYQTFNPNPVAAMPSLHAAYPFLVFLFGLSFFKKRALWFFPYVLMVWVSIVYLGEHYVIDVVFGAIYAALAYLVAKILLHNVKFHGILNRILSLSWLGKNN